METGNHNEEICKKYIENKDTVKELFKEKLNRLEKNILLVASLISEREQVGNKALKEIDEQVMNTKSRIYSLENVGGYSSLNFDGMTHDLKKKVIDLEVAKAKEKVVTWRDKVMLKQKLFEHMDELAMAKTKMDLFQGLKK